MSNGLIGYTGFVGGTLARQGSFDDVYNSKNIESLNGARFETLICAGAPAEKWKANRFPLEDAASLDRLKTALDACQAERVVLISTVDVYRSPREVDETTVLDAEATQPYGKHRLLLERFVAARFAQHHIVRLPALFGTGLKKNFVFDLLNDNRPDLTDCRSRFQFYDLRRLTDDLNVVIERDLKLVNFATEPVLVSEIATRCFDVPFENTTEAGPVEYDVRSIHAADFGGTRYMYDAEETFRGLRSFVQESRGLKNS